MRGSRLYTYGVLFSTISILLFMFVSVSYAVDLDSVRERVRDVEITIEEKVEDAQERIQEAREKGEAVRETTQQVIENINQEAQLKRDEITQKIVERFDNHLDSIIAHLEKLKTYVSEKDHISDADKDEIIASIDTRIHSIQDALLSVSSIEDIQAARDIVSDVQNDWCLVQRMHQKSVGLVLAQRYEGYVDKLTNLQLRIQEKILTLDSTVVDVTLLEQSLISTTEEIVNAKSVIESARASLDEVSTSGECHTAIAFSDTIDQIKESKDALYSSVQALREAINELQVNEEVVNE